MHQRGGGNIRLEDCGAFMIYPITHALLIPKVMELARVLETDPEILEKKMIACIGRKDAVIFISEKADDLNGFILASIEEFNGSDALYIQACVIKPDANEKNIGCELLSKIKKWGREQGVSDIYFMTRRNPKAYQRKYHFKYHATVLKGSI